MPFSSFSVGPKQRVRRVDFAGSGATPSVATCTESARTSRHFAVRRIAAAMAFCRLAWSGVSRRVRTGAPAPPPRAGVRGGGPGVGRRGKQSTPLPALRPAQLRELRGRHGSGPVYPCRMSRRHGDDPERDLVRCVRDEILIAHRMERVAAHPPERRRTLFSRSRLNASSPSIAFTRPLLRSS